MSSNTIHRVSRSRSLLQRSSGGRAVRAFTDVIRAVAQAASGGVGSALGMSTGSTVGIDPQYADMLQTQMEFQQQMQLVSLESNRQRTDHEAKMTVIRNTRVG